MARSEEPSQQTTPARVLSLTAIAISAVILIGIAVGSSWLLLTFYGSGSPVDAARLDAIRTTASIALGTGGAAALLLAARRQRSTEQTLVHQQQVALATERDNLERRITELYTKAAEQLGSDKAPVRLAAVYALERLGQDNVNQRTLVTNLFCAYLRMPVLELPESREEHEVRDAIVGILCNHLTTKTVRSELSSHDDPFWPGQSLNLTGANLPYIHLRGAEFDAITLDQATIAGRFVVEKFRLGGLSASEAHFNGRVEISQCFVVSMAYFRDAYFNSPSPAELYHTAFPQHVDLSANFRVKPDLTDSSVAVNASDDRSFGPFAPDGWKLVARDHNPNKLFFFPDSQQGDSDETS